VVDRALLDSLQNLKSSMASVENSNQALRLENDFYRRQIEAIQQALNPSPEPPPAPLVEKWHMRIEQGLDGKETVTICPYIVGASVREVPVQEQPGPVDDGLTMQQLTQVD
jgi:hypothetical protein